MSLYELYRQLSKYESMRDNLNRAYNILSNPDIQDNLSVASHSLKANYIVNDSAFREGYIKKAKEELSSCAASLRQLISSANSSISRIRREINRREEEIRQREAAEQNG